MVRQHQPVVVALKPAQAQNNNHSHSCQARMRSTVLQKRGVQQQRVERPLWHTKHAMSAVAKT